MPRVYVLPMDFSRYPYRVSPDEYRAFLGECILTMHSQGMQRIARVNQGTINDCIVYSELADLRVEDGDFPPIVTNRFTGEAIVPVVLKYNH